MQKPYLRPFPSDHHVYGDAELHDGTALVANDSMSPPHLPPYHSSLAQQISTSVPLRWPRVCARRHIDPPVGNSLSYIYDTTPQGLAHPHVYTCNGRYGIFHNPKLSTVYLAVEPGDPHSSGALLGAPADTSPRFFVPLPPSKCRPSFRKRNGHAGRTWHVRRLP